MDLQFNELDFALFKNAEKLYDSFLSNLNNCLATLAVMRDDLAKYVKDQFGTRGKWIFTNSANNVIAFPTRKGGKFDLQNMYFSQEVEIKREKPKEGFFINVEYVYDSEELKTFVFWWQIGQTKKEIGLKVLFDEAVLARMKATALKAGLLSDTYIHDTNDDGWQSIYIGIPVSKVHTSETIIECHRYFKNSIVKPLLQYLKKIGSA